MDYDSIRSSYGRNESPGKYVSAIYRHLQILLADRLKPFRIGSGQYIFLLAIFGKEGVTQKTLAEELLIDKTTTAKAIKKLEKEGYVRREINPSDNRYHLLYLTEWGKDVVPKIQEVLDKIGREIREGVDDEAYEIMLESLQKMLCNLSEQIKGER